MTPSDTSFAFRVLGADRGLLALVDRRHVGDMAGGGPLGLGRRGALFGRSFFGTDLFLVPDEALLWFEEVVGSSFAVETPIGEA